MVSNKECDEVYQVWKGSQYEKCAQAHSHSQVTSQKVAEEVWCYEVPCQEDKDRYGDSSPLRQVLATHEGWLMRWWGEQESTICCTLTLHVGYILIVQHGHWHKGQVSSLMSDLSDTHLGWSLWKSAHAKIRTRDDQRSQQADQILRCKFFTMPKIIISHTFLK
jgi:hypothetical protein